MKDIIFLLLTGLLAAYLCWLFYQRYARDKGLYNLYYLMGFAVLLVSGLLLIFLGLGILASRRMLPRPASLAGAFYLLAGLMMIALGERASLLPLAMGGVFAVGQFTAAIILYLTLERGHGKA